MGGESIASWPKGLRRVFYAVVVASGVFVLQLGFHWGRGMRTSSSTIVYMVASTVLYAVTTGAAVRGSRTAFVRAALALAALHFTFMALFFVSALQAGLATGRSLGVLAWNGVVLMLSAVLGGYLLASERETAKKR